MDTVNISQIVLDVLKPRKPSIVELGKDIRKVKGVKSVNLIVTDVDEKTEKVSVLITGKSLKVEKIRSTIEDSGATVHSLDEATIT